MVGVHLCDEVRQQTDGHCLPCISGRVRRVPWFSVIPAAVTGLAVLRDPVFVEGVLVVSLPRPPPPLLAPPTDSVVSALPVWAAAA